MVSRSLSVAAVALGTLLVNVAAAWAGDPSQVGRHVEDIVTPNVKSFWKIAVIVGVLVGLFTRKFNVLGIFLIIAVVAGMIIYNPAGFGNTVSGIAQSVL
jgi:hypothetical protein